MTNEQMLQMMEAMAAQLSGTAIASNGKARKATSKPNGKLAMVPISLDDLRNAPQRVSASLDLPDDALTCVTARGKQCAIYPAQIGDTKAVKFTALPWKKDFVSIDTLRTLADPEVYSMLCQFVEDYGGK